MYFHMYVPNMFNSLFLSGSKWKWETHTVHSSTGTEKYSAQCCWDEEIQCTDWEVYLFVGIYAAFCVAFSTKLGVRLHGASNDRSHKDRSFFCVFMSRHVKDVVNPEVQLITPPVIKVRFFSSFLLVYLISGRRFFAQTSKSRKTRESLQIIISPYFPIFPFFGGPFNNRR